MLNKELSKTSSMLIKKLSWDSDFFAKKIGKYEADESFNWNKFKEEAQQFEMVYVFSKKPIPFNLQRIDIKNTYAKTVIPLKATNPNIVFYNHQEDDYNQLLQLAYLSGHDSRFKRDPFFGEENFRRLYKKWLDKNLVEKDNFVLIYKDKDEIAGFISFAKKPASAAIELVAVSNHHQGKGIGKQLLQAVETQLPKNTILTVPTQNSNTTACAFYERAGFTLTHQTYIYHYEPNPI